MFTKKLAIFWVFGFGLFSFFFYFGDGGLLVHTLRVDSIWGILTSVARESTQFL